ncbi:efflux RND transporter permease subunit [bacterium]|nr:efflux RND transporter permease subunit [candidate division CSSED10-310 bacterium]
MVTERTFIHPLPRWAHHRPVTAVMSCLCILVIGLFALIQLPLEFAPETSSPWMWLNVPYPNSTPEEVDKAIARPLEEQLKLMRSIKRIIMTSSTMGCNVNIQFNDDADMDNAYLEARDAIDRAKADFPDEIGTIRLFRQKSDDIPILWMGLALPDKSVEELFWIVNDRVKPAIERIPGVASVTIHGLDGENLQIDLNLDSIQSHGISIYNLFRVLSVSNENPSVGTLNDGGNQILVRTRFRLDEPDDFNLLPLGDGILQLGDVARVEQRLPEKDSVHHINGENGFTISVSKESAGNAVEIGKRVQHALDDLARDPELKGLKFLVFFDQSDMIVSSLRSLLTTGMWGALFALLVLYLFLRDFGTTCIVVISIPLSILAAVTGLYFCGYSLNIGTMMGLMLAIGMLVDNSVVSTENIFRYRRMLHDPEQAAILGASQVGTAINASTFTTIIVFLPLIFASGELGIWMRQIGLPIAFSLTASLFIALSAVPLAITRLIKKPLLHQSKVIPIIIRYYQKFLTLILDHKLIATLIIIAILSSTSIALKGVPSNMTENAAMRQLVIRLNPPINYDLEQRETVLTRFEEILLANKDKIDLVDMYSSIDSDRGYLRMFLRESGKDLMKDEDVKSRIREMLPEMPGVTWTFGWQGGESTGNIVDITFMGDSSTILRQLGEDSKSWLLQSPDVLEVTASDDENILQEIHLSIDPNVAHQNGISAAEIAQTVGIALMGRKVSRFHTGKNEIDVRMQLEESDRDSLFRMLNIRMFSSDGHPVPLKTLVKYSVVPGPGPIKRIDGKVQHVMQIEMAERDMVKARKVIESRLSAMPLPPGYSWDFGQTFFDFDLGMKQVGQAFLLASILVLLLLGALFESLLHPFTILVSLPFALVGAFWSLRITGSELNITANIGLIILIGIVVNNAIVLVDHINQLRAAGMTRRDALLQAGEDRLRPIVMTAATTILGLAPMATASGDMSARMYSSLAITVMGGLITSTLLTLLVLPLAYVLMDNFQQTIIRWFHSFYPATPETSGETR